jgi:hypothetical protein
MTAHHHRVSTCALANITAEIPQKRATMTRRRGVATSNVQAGSLDELRAQHEHKSAILSAWRYAANQAYAVLCYAVLGGAML